MTKHLAILWLSCVLAALPAAAQNPCQPMHAPRLADMPIMGWRYGAPQKLSAYAGPVWVLRDTESCIDALTASVDLGMGGGQASGGYLLSRRGAGSFRLQESILRTWGHPLHAPPGRIYAGTELQWAFLVGLRVGRYYQIAGPQPRTSFTAISVVVGW
jgi:hypothetical protein